MSCREWYSPWSGTCNKAMRILPDEIAIRRIGCCSQKPIFTRWAYRAIEYCRRLREVLQSWSQHDNSHTTNWPAFYALRFLESSFDQNLRTNDRFMDMPKCVFGSCTLPPVRTLSAWSWQWPDDSAGSISPAGKCSHLLRPRYAYARFSNWLVEKDHGSSAADKKEWSEKKCTWK